MKWCLLLAGMLIVSLVNGMLFMKYELETIVNILLFINIVLWLPLWKGKEK